MTTKLKVKQETPYQAADKEQILYASAPELVGGQQSREIHTTSKEADQYKEFIKIQQQTRLTKMIAANQLKSSLPNHNPPTFSGEVMEYSAFDTLVESKVDDPLELLYYLEQYAAGKAKEIIKGCFQNKSTTSYKEAKALLKRHFGDPFKVANAYITQLLMRTSIKPNDGGKFQEFAIILEQAKAVMRQLWEKLPSYLHSKWCERAQTVLKPPRDVWLSLKSLSSLYPSKLT